MWGRVWWPRPPLPGLAAAPWEEAELHLLSVQLATPALSRTAALANTPFSTLHAAGGAASPQADALARLCGGHPALASPGLPLVNTAALDARMWAPVTPLPPVATRRDWVWVTLSPVTCWSKPLLSSAWHSLRCGKEGRGPAEHLWSLLDTQEQDCSRQPQDIPDAHRRWLPRSALPLAQFASNYISSL